MVEQVPDWLSEARTEVARVERRLKDSNKFISPGIAYAYALYKAFTIPAEAEDGSNPYLEACADLNQMYYALSPEEQATANSLLAPMVANPESFTGPSREDDFLKAALDEILAGKLDETGYSPAILISRTAEHWKVRARKDGQHTWSRKTND